MNEEKSTEDLTHIQKYEQWVEGFSSTYNRLKNYAYTPQYGNIAIKDVNVHPSKPTKEALQKMLLSPQNYENEMRSFSEYLYYAVTQYERTVQHNGNILDFDYVLVNYDDEPEGAEKAKRYKYNKKKAEMWLKKFKVKDQLANITTQIVLKGGKFFYLRFSDEYILLQEMPEEYSYITSKNEITYSYGFDMTFFDKYPDSIGGYAPEFGEWFKEFMYQRRFDRDYWIYKQMPEELSVVFKFDEWSPLIRPPFSGTFKDALQIEDYKDMLRLKTELETWKVIFMEIPKDKDGIPTIDEKLAARFNNLVQNQLPTGVIATSTPFAIEPVSFEQSQNMNQIVGKGEEIFWNGTGVANLFNGDAKGNMALKASIMSDYLMMSQMYDQYERFINYHLNLICKEYKFGIKFLRRCAYFKDEDTDRYFKEMQGGSPPELFMASKGFEPHEMESFLKASMKSGIRDLFQPTSTAFTQSGNDEGGRPSINQSDLSEAGEKTASRGDNLEK